MAAFEWLQQQVAIYGDVLPFQILSYEFKYRGERVPLLGPQGIWKPQLIKQYPLSITSVPESVYPDRMISDNRLHYSYRGTNPNHRDNVGLQEAMKNKIPLIYFQRIVKGKYFVHWPVYIVHDEPQELRFTIEFDQFNLIQNQELVLEDQEVEYGRRQYITREVVVRGHQRSFREKVLLAYQEHCAICKLKHRELLDAAHIIPDKDGGEPVVQNGLALCKIHHAAFDQNIIGITPDYQIHVRKDILEEIDGPMLKHGIQEMHGSELILPRSAAKRPKREWLEERYGIFKNVI